MPIEWPKEAHEDAHKEAVAEFDRPAKARK
jgi:hypothetical protein